MNIILMDRRGWGTICTTTDILDSGNVSTDRRDGYTWVNFCCIQYVYSIQYILYTVYSGSLAICAEAVQLGRRFKSGIISCTRALMDCIAFCCIVPRSKYKINYTKQLGKCMYTPPRVCLEISNWKVTQYLLYNYMFCIILECTHDIKTSGFPL